MSTSEIKYDFQDHVIQIMQNYKGRPGELVTTIGASYALREMFAFETRKLNKRDELPIIESLPTSEKLRIFEIIKTRCLTLEAKPEQRKVGMAIQLIEAVLQIVIDAKEQTDI